MWFEIAIFILSAALPWCRKPQRAEWTPEKKGCLAVWALAPALYVLLYQRAFPVKGLLAVMFAYGWLWQSGSVLQSVGKLAERVPVHLHFRLRAVLVTKIAAVLCLYVFAVRCYVPDASDSAGSKCKAMLFFAAVSACLFFSRKIWARAEAAGWGIPQSVLGAAVPVFGFYLVECIYNPYLEEMSLRFVTGNLLWLAALFLILYFAVPWKRAAAGVFLTLCLSFGAGNYYVELAGALQNASILCYL